MKHTIYLFLICYLWIGCTTEKPPTRLDLAHIKDCAIEGISSFDMDSLINRPDTLSRQEVEILGKIAINEMDSWRLTYSKWEGYYCYEWEENEQHFLFTMVHRDGICCLNLFLVLCNLEGQVLAISELGTMGGDGGEFFNSRGKVQGFGAYVLSHRYTFDQDSINTADQYVGYNREEALSEIGLRIEGDGFAWDTLQTVRRDTLILSN